MYELWKMEMSYSRSVSDWWDLFDERDSMWGEVTADWKAHKLDAVICPTFACLPLPFGAHVKDTCKPFLWGELCMWN